MFPRFSLIWKDRLLLTVSWVLEGDWDDLLVRRCRQPDLPDSGARLGADPKEVPLVRILELASPGTALATRQAALCLLTVDKAMVVCRPCDARLVVRRW